MSEPEALLADGARNAAVAVRELWRRGRPAANREVALADVKRRLELFLAALYGAAWPIVPADAPPRPTWLARVLGRAPGHLVVRAPVAATDGVSIRLPRALPIDGHDGGATQPACGEDGRAIQRGCGEDRRGACRAHRDGSDAAFAGVRGSHALYRLLAVEQAMRAVRGTHACASSDRLEHDLAMLAESVAIDRELVRSLPGLGRDLVAARHHALARRPALERLTPVERAVEQMVQDVLSSDALDAPRAVPLCATPDDSRAWARAVAATLRASGDRYRGVAVVPLWGTIVAALERANTGRTVERTVDDDGGTLHRPLRSASLRRRPRPRRGTEDDERPGTWIVRADDPMESIEDPMGLNRPSDRDEDADPTELADALSELPEARVVETSGPPREVLDGDAATPGATLRFRAPAADSAGIVYPEWDHRLLAYRDRGAIVRAGRVPDGSQPWVDAVMHRHAGLVRRVRRRFDAMRPRRVQLGRQPDGTEVDIAAYVAARADWQAGAATDDRLYRAARPARRELAIALLVDVSASTDSWVAGTQRIIDVEKESLIVLLEAFDALGDRHAAFAFSGEGARRVCVTTLKGFDERTGAHTRRRVAALEPDGYTRAGAAIRHASAQLARQPARHRLLLILSDGKPNDVDEYGGRYGIEDMRQAIAEARRQGLVPFCLTVDHDAPAYMPRIFGRHGFALLRRQDLLPGVLVEVVRRLLVA